MSSKETTFSMDLLKRLDSEIVIGQVSYMKRADIYNDVHKSTSNDHKYAISLTTCACISTVYWSPHN